MKKLIAFVMLNLSLETAYSNTLEESDLAHRRIIQSESGNGEAVLWLPMKDFLRSFPLGFSVCSPHIDEGAEYEMDPMPASKPRLAREKGCLAFNYVTLDAPTTLTVKTTDGERFETVLQPRVSLVYRDITFQPLRTDFKQFITLTYSQKIPVQSKDSWLCSNRQNPLVRIETRPFGTNEDFQDVHQFTSVNSYCSIIESFPWQKDYWETYFTFADGLRVKLVQKVD